MAKYTMLLAEYLQKGGQLPASFSLIQGLEDLFVAKYCDHEIGFETDELFRIKLEYKANLLIPMYKQRIDMLSAYWTKAENPTKVFYEKSTTLTNIGNQKNTTTDLPFNSVTAEPNSISDLGERQDTGKTEIRREENGETADEVLRIIDFLNKEVNPLIEKLLNEFKTLFMGVY